MRALIVDDEALARSKLLHMLQAFPDVEVIAEASDGAEALMLAAQLRPDVIFLDVQMPEIDGFDVAASLPDDAPGSRLPVETCRAGAPRAHRAAVARAGPRCGSPER
jgi:DNA-binding NarL/FixJ family response regulator